MGAIALWLASFMAGPVGSFLRKYLLHIIIAAVVAAGAWFIWHHYTSLVDENEANKKSLILKDEELKAKQKQLDNAIEINKKNEAVIKDLQSAIELSKKTVTALRTDLRKQNAEVAEIKRELNKIKEVAALTPPLRFAVSEMNRLQEQLNQEMGTQPRPAAKPKPKPAPPAASRTVPGGTIGWSSGRTPNRLTNLSPSGGQR